MDHARIVGITKTDARAVERSVGVRWHVERAPRIEVLDTISGRVVVSARETISISMRQITLARQNQAT